MQKIRLKFHGIYLEFHEIPRKSPLIQRIRFRNSDLFPQFILWILLKFQRILSHILRILCSCNKFDWNSIEFILNSKKLATNSKEFIFQIQNFFSNLLCEFTWNSWKFCQIFEEFYTDARNSWEFTLNSMKFQGNRFKFQRIHYPYRTFSTIYFVNSLEITEDSVKYRKHSMLL